MIVLTYVLLGSLHLAAIISQNLAGRNSSFCTGSIRLGAPLFKRIDPFVGGSKEGYKKPAA